MNVLSALAVGAALLMQTAAPAAPADFSGHWVLDKDISTDLTKLSLEPQVQRPQRNSGFSGGGFGRGGSRRQGGGGYGGNRGVGNPLTPEEKARLKEFADYIKGFATLTIEQTDHATFSVTDASGRSHLFATDGAKTPVALASASVDSVTKWDAAHLVTTFPVGPAEDLVFTYVLVPATKQMALRVRLDESGRARGDVPDLHLIYKLAH